MRTLLCTAFSLALAGHAMTAMAADTTQRVSVSVTEAGKQVSAVPCVLKNSVGSWDVTAPGTAVVRTASDELVVSCEKGGSAARVTLEASEKAKWCWGSTKCGGFGYITDARNGHEYPNSATVEL